MNKPYLKITVSFILIFSLVLPLHAQNRNRDLHFQLVNSDDHIYAAHEIAYHLNKDGSKHYILQPKHKNNGNYYRKDIEEAVNTFYADYIDGKIRKDEKEWMFKCEMEIIKFLEKKVTYATKRYKTDTTKYEDYTAYGALIDGEAVCSGYASAFVALARRCGLEAYIVKSDTHAWNVIKLDDGQYYNVDVTWNDTQQETNNMYINLTNDMLLLRDTKDHNVLKNFEFDCNAYNYGPEKVEFYLQK